MYDLQIKEFLQQNLWTMVLIVCDHLPLLGSVNNLAHIPSTCLTLSLPHLKERQLCPHYCSMPSISVISVILDRLLMVSLKPHTTRQSAGSTSKNLPGIGPLVISTTRTLVPITIPSHLVNRLPSPLNLSANFGPWPTAGHLPIQEAVALLFIHNAPNTPLGLDICCS